MAINKITEEWSTGDIISSSRLNGIQNTINNVIDFVNDINFISTSNSTSASGKQVATTQYVQQVADDLKVSPTIEGTLTVGTTATSGSIVINGPLTVGTTATSSNVIINGSVTASRDIYCNTLYTEFGVNVDDTSASSTLNGSVTIGELEVTKFISIPSITSSDKNYNIQVNTAGQIFANIPYATSSVAGVIKVGSHISISDTGTISPDYASTSAPGIIQVGNNLSINDGVLSSNYPTFATTSTAGIIKIGSHVSISDTGTLSSDYPDYASSSTAGIIKVGNNLTIESDGTLNGVGNVQANEGSTENSLVTAGDKYNWNSLLSLLEIPTASSNLTNIYVSNISAGSVTGSANNMTLTGGTATIYGSVTLGTPLVDNTHNGLLLNYPLYMYDTTGTVTLTADELRQLKALLTN